MALKNDRVIDEKHGALSPQFGFTVAPGHTVYRHAICAVCQEGHIVPAGAKDSASVIVAVAGIARHQQSDRDPGYVDCMKACFALPFDTAPSWADVGKPVYAIDDETVTLTETSSDGKRLRVGSLAGIEIDGTPFVTVG